MRLRAAAVLVLVLISARELRASYMHLPFGYMVKRADAMVVGTIRSVSESDFELQVEEVVLVRRKILLKPGETLKIRRFRNWTCASRWTAYASGQQLLAALVRGKEDGLWRTMGAAAEGEMPVENGRVYVGGSGDGMPTSDKNKHRVYGADYWGKVFWLRDAIYSVRTRKLPPALAEAPFRPSG